MVKLSCILRKNLFYPQLFMALMFVFSAFDKAEAILVTIDAGGSAATPNYQSLDGFFAKLDAMDSASVPDTVLFKGSRQYTYTASQYVVNAKSSKKMYFLSTATNPDSFPIINHTAETYYDFFGKTPTSFERLIFTGTLLFENGNSPNDLLFSQCVIRNYKANFFLIAGDGSPNIHFSNCLFVNNADTIFESQFWGSGNPHLEITNCTFDNNLAIFNIDQANNSNKVFKNNIFSNNKSTFPGPLLKAKTTYSIISESKTDYDSTCYQLLPADTTALYKFTSRTNDTIPSHWKLGSTSKAGAFLRTAAVLSVDIAGTSRGVASLSDVGCWKFENALKIVTQPKSDTVVVNTNVVFKVVASSSTPITYAWYRKGVATPISTTDSCPLVAASTLDSTRYWCVVTNTGESKPSDTVTLRIINKPVILNDKSEGILVSNGDTASFKISATGFKLSYKWYLGTAILKTDTLKPYCKIDTIKKDVHDNALLYCEVSNPAEKTKSLVDTLHVRLNLPVISTQPISATVNQGQTATFSVVAAPGNGPLQYTWFQTDSAGTTKTKLSSDSASLILPNVLIASSGSAYYCVVSTMYGDSTKSNLVFLKVNAIKAPVIIECSPNLQTTVGSKDSLYVKVNGNGTKYDVAWYKDGSPIVGANSTVYVIPNTVMSKDSSYNYYCVVSYVSGSVTSNIIKVTINKKGSIYNPITLKGKFINRSSIRLTIKNFMSLPVKNNAVVYVDTVGVWYKSTDYQFTPDRNSKNLINVPLDLLLAKGVNDSFDTLINIPMGDAECDSICFVATPFWKPDTLPPFIIANGAKVYSCGSDSIINPLSLKISQPEIGAATLSINGFSNLNKSNVSYIVTFYGHPGSFIYDTIKTDKFPSTDLFTSTYNNALFTGLTHTISWGVYIRGIDGNYSNTVIDDQIKVGYPQPKNDATLSVGSVDASEVVLNWTKTTADSIRIWYGTDTIPLFDGITFPSTAHQSKTVPATQDTIFISGLSDNKKYYFGLQSQSNGVWSGTAAAARCFATTGNLDVSKIKNTIKITEAFFDTLTNKFVVKFTFDSTGSGKNLFFFKHTISKSGYNGEGETGSVSKLKFITDGDTTIDTIAWDDSLASNTKYYISLRAQSYNASWAEPTDSSRVTVTTREIKWMKIVLFNPNESIFTTFEGKVQFKKSPGWYVSPWNDEGYAVRNTLDIYKFNPVQIPAGFKVVSSGIKFRHQLITPELHLGIRIDSLPQGDYSLKDVNMYVYDTLTRNFKVIYTRDIDDGDSIISVLIRPQDYTSPLILMIDTLKPVVTISGDTASALDADGNDLIYNMGFKDNVSNMIVTFKYGIGENTFSSTKNDTIGDSTYQFKVPSSVISENTGVRVMLIVNDGSFTDTIDLSRVVSTTTDKVLKTDEMKWFPLCVHYELNSLNVKQLFDSLSGSEKKYDNTKFRLFKWSDSLKYKTEVGKYVEYDKVTENDTLFDLKPGNLLWLKTRKPTTLNFGKVKTLSLKKSYSVTLPPNTWTDVAVPFEYSIKIYDILQATRIDNVKNKLIINKWQTTTSKYSSAAIHNPTMGGESHPEVDMSGTNNDIYTIYNFASDPTDTVILKFPPIPSSMTKYVSLTKKQASSDWRFTISAATENEDLNPIYCGFTNEGLKKTLIPVAPSLGLLKMGVVENGNLYGIDVAHEKAEGYAYNLKFENKEVGKQSVKCYIVENVASGMNMKLFDPITGITVGVNAGFTVDVDGQSSAQRWLLVGNDAFVGKFIQKNVEFSLLQLYPNPFRGVLNIKFMIPLAGVNSVNCMLFDPLGRQVWDFKIDKELHPGQQNLFVWQPGQGSIKKLASGTYFLKLVAKDSKGKITGSKLAKLMYFTN